MSTEPAEPQRTKDSSPLRVASDTILPWAAVVPVAALAVFLGRGLAPALPGSRAGIEIWITRVEIGSASVPALGAWLTQLTLLCASWLCMHFSLLLLGQPGIKPALRAITTVVGAALFAIVALANVAQGQLGESWLVGAALCAATLGAVASSRALRQPTTRAAGIVLLLTTSSGLTQLGSRVLALQASSQARTTDFMVARGCASVSFAINVALLVLVVLWMVRSTGRKPLLLTVAALLPAPLITFAAMRSAREGAPWWQELAARTLSELRTHPDPFVIVPLRDSFELSTLFLGVLVLFRPQTAPALRAAIGLCLVSRANIDIPLCALLLGCAALLCLTFTIGEEPAPKYSTKREHNRAEGSAPATQSHIASVAASLS